MKPPADAKAAAVAALCPTCALCCNGVLFADVRLQKGDSARRLAALEVPLRRHGAVVKFAQPCACLEGHLCRIYQDRPSRCRSFECRLVERLAAGGTTEARALKAIKEARSRADKVRRILRALGDKDEARPLSQRYQRVMRQPMDCADERDGELRGKLMMAVAALAEVLERDFLT